MKHVKRIKEYVKRNLFDDVVNNNNDDDDDDDNIDDDDVDFIFLL